MDFINTGSGYFGDVISVAVVAFLILLAAFSVLNVIIARRYHASKHTFAEEARRPQDCAARCSPAGGGDQLSVITR